MTKRVKCLVDDGGMSKCHPKIPPDIHAGLSAKARKFVGKLIDDYEARILELEAKLVKLTPQNSSIPSGSLHPHTKVVPPAKKKRKGTKKKKHGGQPGHPRSVKPLIPTDACNDVEVLRPNSCRKCNEKLKGNDPQPLRHQVYELPEIQPIVTEYQRHRLTCDGCGTQTCAALPPSVPTGQCGPRLAAFTGLLLGHFRQSKRRAASFLGDLLNIPCSASWTVKIQNQVSDALAAPHEELRKELENQKQLFVDESPTKQHKHKAWLWVAVAPMFAVFGIYLSRKRTALKELVGNYAGIIINCDRAKMYYDGKLLQWCWAHLKRDIQKLIDNPDHQVKRLGHDLMRQQRLLFENWRIYKAKEISWKVFQKKVKPIESEFNSLLVRGVFSGNSRLIGMCEELWNHRDWLWTFTKSEGIEPTNNTAERALRPAVIYRKLSFGTQSAAGSRFIERMLTLSETCRMQNRSAYAYLVSAMQAHFAKEAPPSLMPQAEAKDKKRPAKKVA